jgi:hypothetical protein
VIYARPAPEEPIDQGNLIDDFPVVELRGLRPDAPDSPSPVSALRRVIVVTQTCDLANAKATTANVAEAFDADFLVARGIFKPADVRGPLRGGRVWGVYFLPAEPAVGLNEMIVDLRRLHTVPVPYLRDWSHAGRRRPRVVPPYREHLARHFAETFGRIGLPRPYETM